ncbi:MAG: glycosyltransferase [Martelella sp.]|uniref:CgeB family protein n=1 Tax=Martelella sp. TaxID=1969699 RepID=UPI003241EC16
MHFTFYTHSLVSDWNHGNAHFLRGVMRALMRRGHTALALERKGSWSRDNLLSDQGPKAVADFDTRFPHHRSELYDDDADHEALIGDADIVVVHEWTDPALVARLGRLRRRGGKFLLLFHDTHHRAVSAETEIAGLDLDGYDGVLAFGATLKERYLKAGWGRRVFVWHEAADTALFHPLPDETPSRDLVWIGNWGDGERSNELNEFLIEPARALDISGTVHGVRYPPEALEALAATRLDYRGWIANADVPLAFARHRVTVHIPRRPYVESLPGIPTIRVLEALASGIPLVSAPWSDAEGLFRPGTDYLQVSNGEEMRRQLRAVLSDPDLATSLVKSGYETIRARHTCEHRVNELLAITETLGGNREAIAEGAVSR